MNDIDNKEQSARETWDKLFSIDVNQNVRKKKKLNYLSWAWAWAEACEAFPDLEYQVVMFDGLPYIYDPKTGYMVFTNVTIKGQTREMWLPVMDGANKAMLSEAYTYTTKFGDKRCEAASMFDINKTIMRCLTKNLGMFGLGLYLYANEDMPESTKSVNKQKKEMFKKLNQAVNDSDHFGVAEFKEQISGEQWKIVVAKRESTADKAKLNSLANKGIKQFYKACDNYKEHQEKGDETGMQEEYESLNPYWQNRLEECVK